MVPPTQIRDSREQLGSLSPKPPGMGEGCVLARRTPDLDLSIIVPVYNVADYVGPCLDSILSQQTALDFEIVVVNDGSTDHSLGEIHLRMQKDPRIVLIDQANRGLSGARNVGLEQSRGKKISFVDSDDMLAPNHIENLNQALEAGDWDFASGRFTYVDQGGKILRSSAIPRNHGAPWGRLYHRKVWEKISFPEGYWFEDTIHAYCIDSQFVEKAVPEETGYFYREHQQSICSRASSGYRALDSFWIVEHLLDRCRSLQIPLTSALYELTLKQFGPLLKGRTAALNGKERQALFSACCDLIAGIPEFQSLRSTLPGRWADVEQALRTRNYPLWILACRQLR